MTTGADEVLLDVVDELDELDEVVVVVEVPFPAGYVELSSPTLMLAKDPRMWIFLCKGGLLVGGEGTREHTYVSASTIRVRLAFSIVNLVLPS